MMWVKIIWILLGIDALMFLGILFIAITANSDAAGNSMSAGMAAFAGIFLLGAALPIMISHHTINLIISSLLASLPLLGIVIFFVPGFFSSQSEQQTTAAGYHFSDPEQQAIAQAIENNDSKLLQKLIKGKDLNVTGNQGLNFLQFAIRLADLQADEVYIQESVRILIEGGANPDALDQESYSPSMLAASRNLWTTVLYFLEEANVDYAYTAPDGQSLATIIGVLNQSSVANPSADLLAVREWLEKKGIQVKAAN